MILVPDLRPVEPGEYPDVHLVDYLVGRVILVRPVDELIAPRDPWAVPHVPGRVRLDSDVLLIAVSDDGRTEVAAAAVRAACDVARRAAQSKGETDPLEAARETLVACGILVEQ